MYTQCPQCKTPHTIDASELRATRGMLKCSVCATLFDALEFISDQPLTQPPESQNTEFYPAIPQTEDRLATLWTLGFALALLLLIGQFLYFESYQLSQKQSLRPWLTQLCRTLGCRVPIYKNADEISILQGTLEPTGQHSYRFKATIVNQASFTQPYPDVRLALINFTGEAFAERIFSPRVYRPSKPSLAADESGEIILDITAPEQKIGGYRFKLL